MKPSLWSNFFHQLPGADAVRELTAAGFEYSELSPELLIDRSAGAASADMARELRSACDAAGLRTPQLHYPICTLNPAVDSSRGFHADMLTDFAHADAARREFDLRCAEQFLAVCPLVGVEVMVVHPGGVKGWESDTDRARIGALNVEALLRLGEVGESHGVIVALENMAVLGAKQSFGATFEELMDLLNRVGSRSVGICLDTSHANVMKLDMPAGIRRLGERLVATHISDNLGAHDDHLLPYAGRVAWPPIVDALRDIGYQRLFNLEVPGENRCSLEIRRVKARYTRELLEAMLSSAGDRGQ